jgi:peroxiredoxin
MDLLRCFFLLAAGMSLLSAQTIQERLKGLRGVPDSERAIATKKLATDVRQLPGGAEKVRLAHALANLSTEGDFGPGTLQEVAATLAQALREQPAVDEAPYLELAQLARYEHVPVSLDSPRFAAAISQLEQDDRARQQADFSLTDLQGKTWTLKGLRGKVALVNFWATWCPPCRKEIPDLNALQARFASQGLVILGISDEEAAKVTPFVAEKKIAYPVLLDPGRAVHERFRIEGIPKSFVYDREGKLAAQSIDMRTEKQFLEMLSRAGLR